MSAKCLEVNPAKLESLFSYSSRVDEDSPQLKKKLKELKPGAPGVLPFLIRNIPPALAKIRLFIYWTFIKDEETGKLEKRPCSGAGEVRTYKNLQPGSLGEKVANRLAIEERLKRDVPVEYGLLCNGKEAGAIDIDDCVGVDAEGNWLVPDAVEEFAKATGCYVEVSPSGTGLHFIFLGRFPLKSRNIKLDSGNIVEIKVNLSGTRYVTMTGHDLFDYSDSEITEAERIRKLAEWIPHSYFTKDALSLVGIEPTERKRDNANHQPRKPVDENDLADQRASDRHALAFILSKLNRRLDYDDWIKVGMVIADTSLDDVEGLAWFDAISNGGTDLTRLRALNPIPEGLVERDERSAPALGNYDPIVLDRTWEALTTRSVERDEDDDDVTIGTPIKWAMEDSGASYGAPPHTTTAAEDFGDDPGTVDQWKDLVQPVVLGKNDGEPYTEIRRILENMGKYGNPNRQTFRGDIAEQVSIEDLFFRNRSSLVQLRRDDAGNLGMEKLSHLSAEDQISRASRFVVEKVKRDGTVVTAPANSVGEKLAKKILASVSRYPDLIPPLGNIRKKPYIGAAGNIECEPGYSERNRTFLDLPKMFQFDKPTDLSRGAARKAARRLLGAIKSFRIATPEMRMGPAFATIIALVLSPLMRQWWDTCPVFLFTAKRPQAGKSSVVRLAAAISGETKISAQTLKQGPEATKSLEAALLQGKSMLWIDNIEAGKMIANETLEALATSDSVDLRVLGGHNMVTVEPTVIALTGNLSTLGRDMTRRTLQVNLDRAAPLPGVVDYMAWIFARADSLLADALTILVSWIAEARRLGAVRERQNSTPYICANAVLDGMERDSEYTSEQIEIYRDAVLANFPDWSSAVAFACLYADPGRPEWLDNQYPDCAGNEWRLNPSSSLAIRQGINPGEDTRGDEENRALVTVLECAVRVATGETITAAELLIFAFESYQRSRRKPEGGALLEALEICESVGDFQLSEYRPDEAHRMAKTLGRRLSSLSEMGGIVTLTEKFPKTLRVTKQANGKKAVRWGIAEVGWG